MSRLKGTMKRVFYGVFGALAVLMGSLMVAWLVWNLFVEEQPEFKSGFRVKDYLMPFAFIGIGCVWIRKALRHSPDHEGNEGKGAPSEGPIAPK